MKNLLTLPFHDFRAQESDTDKESVHEEEPAAVLTELTPVEK